MGRAHTVHTQLTKFVPVVRLEHEEARDHVGCLGRDGALVDGRDAREREDGTVDLRHLGRVRAGARLAGWAQGRGVRAGRIGGVGLQVGLQGGGAPAEMHLLPLEGREAGEELVQDDAEGPPVARGLEAARTALDRLGRLLRGRGWVKI